MFSNFINLGQKESSEKTKEDSKPKSGHNMNNDLFASPFEGGLSSIKEHHDLEDSLSEIMDKPIRSLREMYTGIKKDIKIQKQQRKKQKEAEESDDSFSTCQEEDFEMESSQKQILEDKVYKLITHWNDMDYIKNHHSSLFPSDKEPTEEPKEEIKEPKEEAKKEEETKEPVIPKENVIKHIETPKRQVTSIVKERLKPSKYRSNAKAKKILKESSKLFKTPVMVQDANKAT